MNHQRNFRTKGLSLLEVLIAAALGGILMLAVGKLLGGFSKQFVNASQSSQTRDALRLLGGHLQKYMGSGDLRFFGFSGRTDRTLARALIPQFGVCGDLSTTDCTQDGAFLYVNYDKLTTPTVSVVCALNPAEDPGTWLIDTKLDTYGPSTLHIGGDGFQVSAGASGIFVAGKVQIDRNAPLALMNPPSASLWVARGKPVLHEFSQDSSGNFINFPTGFTAIDGECLKSFKVLSTSPTLYDLSGVYQIKVRPLSLIQFTGGSPSNINAAVMRTQLVGFPLRVFTADLRAIGKRFVGPQKIPVASVTPCSISNSPAIVCDQDPILQVHNVSRVRIEEMFKIKLGSSTAERYELVQTAADVSTVCKPPRCEAMLIPDSTSIPVLVSSTENFESLDPSQISFLKQEALARMGLRVGINNKEETYDVIFP